MLNSLLTSATSPSTLAAVGCISLIYLAASYEEKTKPKHITLISIGLSSILIAFAMKAA